MNNEMRSDKTFDDPDQAALHDGEALLARAFSQRLRQVIGNRSVLRFSQECGISDSLMRKYLAGSQPGLAKLVRLAEVAGVSVEWLATGREGSEIGALARSAPGSDDHHEPADGQAGGLPPLFDRRWLNHEAHSLQHMTAVCDSMEPTISIGAPLLIDPSFTQVRHDAIYMLRWQGTLVPKRLQIDWEGGVWVRSDNPLYEDQRIPAQAVHRLDVVGRVVWVGRRI